MSRAEALDAVAGAGYRIVELSGRSGQLDDWFGDPAGMRRDLNSRSMRAFSVHAPDTSWDMSSPDESVRMACIRSAVSCFGPAVDVGSDLVICHGNAPRGKPFDPADFDASIRRSRETLAVVAEHAGRAGVRLAVETMIPRIGRRPLTRVAEILQAIEGFGDHVGICMDTGHTNAGEGAIDWAAFHAVLDRLGFKAPRIIEIGRQEGERSTAEAIAKLAELRVRWEAEP
jgi:sugar phosphate isomerase/epimerase